MNNITQTFFSWLALSLAQDSLYWVHTWLHNAFQEMQLGLHNPLAWTGHKVAFTISGHELCTRYKNIPISGQNKFLSSTDFFFTVINRSSYQKFWHTQGLRLCISITCSPIFFSKLSNKYGWPGEAFIFSCENFTFHKNGFHFHNYIYLSECNGQLMPNGHSC